MASFRYKGRDGGGGMVEGRLEAASADAVASQLLSSGITPIDIAEADIGWLMDDARREAGLDEWQQALVELAGSIRS